MLMSKGDMLLLDTGEWIDYYIVDRPNHDAAFSLVAQAFARGIPVGISVH